MPTRPDTSIHQLTARQAAQPDAPDPLQTGIQLRNLMMREEAHEQGMRVREEQLGIARQRLGLAEEKHNAQMQQIAVQMEIAEQEQQREAEKQQALAAAQEAAVGEDGEFSMMRFFDAASEQPILAEDIADLYMDTIKAGEIEANVAKSHLDMAITKRGQIGQTAASLLDRAQREGRHVTQEDLAGAIVGLQGDGILTKDEAMEALTQFAGAAPGEELDNTVRQIAASSQEGLDTLEQQQGILEFELEREAALRQAEEQDRIAAFTARNVLEDISIAREALAKSPGPLGRRATSWWPGSDAQTLSAAITSIKNSIGSENLIRFKEADIGFGQITDGNIQFLSERVGSLEIDHADELILTVLDRVEEMFSRAVAGDEITNDEVRALGTEIEQGLLQSLPDDEFQQLMQEEYGQ